MARKWWVCLAVYLVQFTVFGVHNNFGLVYGVFLKQFNESKESTAWIGSFAMGMTFLISPVSKPLIKMLGFHLTMALATILCMMSLITSSLLTSMSWMALTYSFLFGVGSGLANLLSLDILQEYFHGSTKLSLACGVASSGTGIGTLAIAPLLNYLMHSYGFRWAFRILAIFPLLFLFTVIFYKPTLQRAGDVNNVTSENFAIIDVIDANADSHTGFTHHSVNNRRTARNKYLAALTSLFDPDIWCNVRYLLFLCGLAVFFLGYSTPFVFLVEHAQVYGIERNEAQFFIGLLAMVGTGVKVLCGVFLVVVKCIDRHTLFLIGMLTMALTHVIAARGRESWHFYMYAIANGIAEGVIIGQLVAVVTDLVPKKEKVGSALGIVFASMSIPLMVGPFIAGKMADRTYETPFYASAGIGVLGFLVCSLSKILKQKRRPDIVFIPQQRNGAFALMEIKSSETSNAQLIAKESQNVPLISTKTSQDLPVKMSQGLAETGEVVAPSPLIISSKRTDEAENILSNEKKTSQV